MKNTFIGYCINRVRELPPSGVINKAFEKLVAIAACKLENLWAKFEPAYISDEQLFENIDRFENLQEALKCFKGERPKFFFDIPLKGKLVALIKREFPQLMDQILAEANKVCSHVFDLLGSGDKHLDEFVDKHGGRAVIGYLPWHFDFKTGYQWNPKQFYKEVRPAYGKADIKVPWELSRFQHVATLGQAYWLTDDENYAQEFVHEVDDWIDRNPPKFGVNWACTMEVAIRVANWILGFYFFKDSQAFTDELLVKFLKSLLVHGRHIMDNLENKGLTTNHYLADLVGLIYLGIAFPEFKDAKGWCEFGIQELVKEMDKQVYDDGMNFEASTCYHRLALELLFYPAVLCRLNGIEFTQSFVNKMKKMFDFVLYVLKPNGRMPQIGDNDNGRLHILGKRDILDMAYLLTFATIWFDDSRYKIEEFGFAPEALWMFGPEAYKLWKELPARSVEELESRAFRDGGIYVMQYKKDYIVISCGTNGQGGIGGHAHNDKLSFELCVDGEDIIVDPGTYVYTADPKLRNRFRATERHNTITIDGEEQNRFDIKSIFSLGNDALVELNRWESTDEYDFLDAQHSGYNRLPDPVIHRRRFLFNKRQRWWIINDTVVCNREHFIESHFHFDPINSKIKLNDSLVVEYNHPNIIILFTGVDQLSINIKDGCVSSSYGSLIVSKTICCTRTVNSLLPLTVIIYPCNQPQEFPERIKEEVLFCWKSIVHKIERS